MCTGHPLEAGVEIGLITLSRAIRAPKRRTADPDVGLSVKDQALQKAVPGDQSSARCKAEKGLLTLIGRSNKMRSRFPFNPLSEYTPLFTPHFTVLDIWKGFGIS